MGRYSFEYRMIGGPNAGMIKTKSQTWKTQRGAEKAAERWEKAMADEDCPVSTNVVSIGAL